MNIEPGKTSVSIIIQMLDDSGLPVTGLVAATFPTTSYVRAGSAAAAITLSDLAATNSAYSSGGVKEIASGRYRLDVPDAAFASACPSVEIYGEATGKRIVAQPITVSYIQSNVAQVNAVSTSSVTTINANIGTTQPTNFTGTGASATVKGDLVNIAGSAVNTSSAQLGVNVVNFGGSAGTFASGIPSVNSSQFGGATVTATTSVTFPSSCTVATTTGAVGSVTGNVGGNVVGSVGSISGVSFPSNFAALGINASGHVSRVTLVDTTTTNTDMIAAASIRTAVGLASANLDTQLSTIAGYIDTEVAAIKAKTDLIGTTSILTTDSITAAAVSAAAANKIADHARRRTQANVEASSDGDTLSKNSLYGFIQQAQKSSASGTTLTIYKTDGTTTLGTITLTPTAGADPITGVS